VHAKPNMTTPNQAFALGIVSGSAKRAGTVRAMLAPIWLPVADTNAGISVMYFLVKLPEMA